MTPSMPGKRLPYVASIRGFHRLPYVKLMEESSLEQYNLGHHRFLRKCVQFVPYSFKDMCDLDRLEVSALRRLNLMNYVTGIQRLCVADDVFWWSHFNTDADGERLLIQGQNGTTCVVDWHEIQVVANGTGVKRPHPAPIPQSTRPAKMTVRTRIKTRPNISAAGPSNPTVSGPIVVANPNATAPQVFNELELENLVSDLISHIGEVLTSRVQEFLTPLQGWKSKAESLTSELETAGHNESFLKLQHLSLRNDLEKVKAEIDGVWKVKVSTLTSKLGTVESSDDVLQQEVADLRNKLARAKTEADEEAKAKIRAEVQSQFQTSQQEVISRLKLELADAQKQVANCQLKEGAWQAETSTLKKQLEESKIGLYFPRVVSEKTASVQHQVAELQQLVQSKEATAARSKTAVEVEWQKVADLELQLQQNVDIIDGFKYSADRAKKAQVALRKELAEVKELCLLKLAK
ncbi:hypothetical protein R1sor_017614 [Riccia sorocarpa]|uniref:Uncharacterized protein n=1 Tax=Riccia sorocarpa TaxID=122646 RepID=A0ABD3IA57_9MARC